MDLPDLDELCADIAAELGMGPEDVLELVCRYRIVLQVLLAICKGG